MLIGYVGLGNMGGALARRLQLTNRLVIYDLSQTAVDGLVAAGAEPSTGLAELAQRCDIVFLCLPTSEDVEKAIFGDQGLHLGLRAGAMIVDQTTGDPSKTRAIAAKLKARNVDLIDAPVSGGKVGAEQGTIAIMVGASDEQYGRILPILQTISPNIFHAGGVGSGQVVKLVNNQITFAQRLVTLEGLALATKNGVDPHRAVEILLAGGGRNKYLEVLAARILDGQLRLNFTLGLTHKDMRLASDLGRATDVPMPLSDMATDMYAAYIEEAGYNAELEASSLIIQREAGTRFIPEKYEL